MKEKVQPIFKRIDKPTFRDWGIYEGGDLMPVKIFEYLNWRQAKNARRIQL